MRHVPPPDLASPDLGESTRKMLTEMRRLFKSVPDPFLAHVYEPPFLEEMWSWTRTLSFSGRLRREYKDIIAGAVSSANVCSYCVEAHTLLVQHTNREAAQAIVRGAPYRGGDATAERLIMWGRSNLEPTADIITKPPFDRELLPEIIFTAFSYHYMNRFVMVFFGDSPLPPVLPAIKPALLWLAGPALKRLAHLTLERQHMPAGGHTEFVPEDLRWSASDPFVRRAMLGVCAAAGAAGAKSLPAAVRSAIEARLAVWTGEEQSLTGSWINDAIGDLPAAEFDVARFCLLVAMAPNRLQDGDVIRCRRTLRSDADLVRASIWSSTAGARRVAAWLGHAVEIRS